MLDRLTGILLAAGDSRRFGADKRLLVLPNGDPLVVHAAKLLHSVLDDVLIVLRPKDEELVAALEALGCRVSLNPDSQEGMGASIRHGVEQSAGSDGWLIMPTDLPLLRAASIRRVAGSLCRAPAVVPLCHGRRGHPVGFSSRFRDALLSLTGSGGARSVLHAAAHEVCWLNLHDPGIHRDIDHPEEMKAVSRCFRSMMNIT